MERIEQDEIQLLMVLFSIVLLAFLATLFFLFFYFQKKKSKFLIDKIETELLFQSELMNSKIEIKEQTLTNISRELHDNIGQILSVALMEMNVLIENEENYSKNDLVEIKDLITKSLNEIRVLTKLMNGDIAIQSNFIDTISEDLDRIGRLKKMQCKFNIEGKVQKINKEHETIIYRILQEAISNILKHSYSKTILVDILFTDINCKVNIIDSGRGFNFHNSTNGSGIFNMNNRAKLIGATLSIYSEFGKGAKLTIDYPIKVQS
ncbi:sensor histidine kinase [Flavobacterium aestivum]|uniref:sensor histidine kinase n=1 Tax=Flavobacterium aestivum TaxID=3003257 RepID=UPI00248236BE|nr:ATP-binding protein [Flavobacterium aestivum]